MPIKYILVTLTIALLPNFSHAMTCDIENVKESLDNKDTAADFFDADEDFPTLSACEARVKQVINAKLSPKVARRAWLNNGANPTAPISGFILFGTTKIQIDGSQKLQKTCVAGLCSYDPAGDADINFKE